MDQTQHHIKRLHLYVLALVIGVLVLVWFVLSERGALKKQKEKPPVVEKKQLVPKPQKKGAFSLQTKDNQKRFPQGQPLTLELLATSDREDIVGYDVLLKYDQQSFSNPQVKSLLDSFQVFDNQRPDHLSITAIQDLNSNSRIILKNTKLLEVTLMPIKKGKYTFAVIPTSGREQTKLVTTKTQELYTKTSTIQVEIF